MSSSLVQVPEEFGKWIYHQWVRPFSALPLDFGSMLQWLWQLRAFPLASKAFILVMMMACQGHGPSTKQGC